MTNATVKNSTITGLESDNGENTGVAGGIIGIAVEESTIDNVKVTADLPANGESKTYGVFSSKLAGGIAGIDSGKILNSIVENIIVKTIVKLQENTNNSNTESDEPTIDGSYSIYPYADAVHVQYNEDYENCTKTNVDVICGDNN